MTPHALQQLPFENEWEFRTSRSSGKGGQHVNKVETKVELLFSIPNSQLLSTAQIRLALKNLDNRLNSEGVLVLSSASTPSQAANKKAVIKRFYDVLAKALEKPKFRIPTKTPKKAKKKRLEQKKVQALKKEGRRKRDWLG